MANVMWVVANITTDLKMPMIGNAVKKSAPNVARKTKTATVDTAKTNSTHKIH